ncbi:hypothetical protein RirG_176830 [Rhizophagus irregularis DAOM 197198w]|uniref:Protein kinase domain-containing protein n=2 Tax=Rhizophagus irregularis TaxID=588596 RepID=A0A015J213_RHIIW|nr:hypothetical protein RirG_176830 [Rhizophagus irregularis DAOM 197198w]
MLVSIDEEKYSLVLEYADCGTLGKYLRDDTMTFNWENQLRLQVRFYGYMMLRESVHGDLHPNNSFNTPRCNKIVRFLSFI